MGSPLAGSYGTFAANPVQGDIFLVHPAPARDFLGQPHRIKGAPAKIGDSPALPTDCMVVPIHVGLEAGLAFHGFHLGDEVVLLKGGQGPVHGIEGEGGHHFSQPFVKRFSGRVVAGHGELAKYLQPLMGKLEIDGTAGLLKVAQFLFEVFPGKFFRHGRADLDSNCSLLVYIRNADRCQEYCRREISPRARPVVKKE